MAPSSNIENVQRIVRAELAQELSSVCEFLFVGPSACNQGILVENIIFDSPTLHAFSDTFRTSDCAIFLKLVVKKEVEKHFSWHAENDAVYSSDLAELQGFIDDNNNVDTPYNKPTMPLTIYLEGKHCLDMTVILTPPLQEKGELREILKQFCSEPHVRMIGLTVQGEDWNGSSFQVFSSEVDPTFSRTIALRVGVKLTLQNDLRNSVDLFADYFTPFELGKTFFVELDDETDQQLKQLLSGDSSRLPAQINDPRLGSRSLLHFIGKDRFASHVKQIWEQLFLKQLPHIISMLRSKRMQLDNSISKAESEVESLECEGVTTSRATRIFRGRVTLRQLLSQLAQKFKEFYAFAQDLDTDEDGLSIHEETQLVMEDKTGESFEDWADEDYLDAWDISGVNLIDDPALFPTGEYRVIGGAQWTRFLKELDLQTRSRELPHFRPEKFLEALGANPEGFAPRPSDAAEAVLQVIVDKSFKGIITMACDKAEFLLRRSWGVFLRYFSRKFAGDNTANKYVDALYSPDNRSALSEFQTRYNQAVKEVCQAARLELRTYLLTAVKEADAREGTRVRPLDAAYIEAYLNETLTPADVAQRVADEVNKQESFFSVLPKGDEDLKAYLLQDIKTYDVSSETMLWARTWVGYRFAMVREHFCVALRTHMTGFFLTDLFTRLKRVVGEVCGLFGDTSSNQELEALLESKTNVINSLYARRKNLDDVIAMISALSSAR
eukprot:GCRY01002867.1.p1 GENE.GCRY01002867.1~~GCRY01002867.1.p1  ORF type:complete len:776 (-),score=220.25 GCRY01002867.1:598-2769(-)